MKEKTHFFEYLPEKFKTVRVCQKAVDYDVSNIASVPDSNLDYRLYSPSNACPKYGSIGADKYIAQEIIERKIKIQRKELETIIEKGKDKYPKNISLRNQRCLLLFDK